MVVVEGLGCGGYIDLDILVSLRLGPDGQIAHRITGDRAKTAAAVATVSGVIRTATQPSIARRDDSHLLWAAAKIKYN